MKCVNTNESIYIYTGVFIVIPNAVKYHHTSCDERNMEMILALSLRASLQAAPFENSLSELSLHALSKNLC